MHAQSLSPVHGLFATPWTVVYQAPLSMGFSRQEYWSGMPCPPAGDHLDPRIEPVSPMSPALQKDSLLLGHPGSQRFDDPIASPFGFNMLDSLHYICDTWSNLCLLFQNKHQLQKNQKIHRFSSQFQHRKNIIIRIKTETGKSHFIDSKNECKLSKICIVEKKVTF